MGTRQIPNILYQVLFKIDLDIWKTDFPLWGCSAISHPKTTLFLIPIWIFSWHGNQRPQYRPKCISWKSLAFLLLPFLYMGGQTSYFGAKIYISLVLMCSISTPWINATDWMECNSNWIDAPWFSQVVSKAGFGDTPSTTTATAACVPHGSLSLQRILFTFHF